MVAGALAALVPAAAYALSLVGSRARSLALGAAALLLLLAAGASAYLLPQRGNQQSAGIATAGAGPGR